MRDNFAGRLLVCGFMMIALAGSAFAAVREKGKGKSKKQKLKAKS